MINSVVNLKQLIINIISVLLNQWNKIMYVVMMLTGFIICGIIIN